MRPINLIFCFALLFGVRAYAQTSIENVIVETYYISDANDATPTDGGTLAEGSKTYRVYLDLCDSCALLSIYGTSNHPLDISSTAPFYNNQDRGKIFGQQISNSWLDENTVALDSWLSLGAASSTKYGILKSEDTEGDPFGGPNGDGMLMNTAPEAGVPLVQQDGLIDGSNVPPPATSVGLSLDSAFKDSTLTATFISTNTRILSVSGTSVFGPTADNKILVAQLTTTGELSFHLNIEIEKPDGTILRFVATDTLLTNGETPNGLLSFPAVCGCTDPNFLEFDPTAGCDDGSCASEIVFGCTDPSACNFSTSANFNIPSLCCYGPDSCNGLDVNILCPGVGLDEPLGAGFHVDVFPNPVFDELRVQFNGLYSASGLCVVLDRSGRVVRELQLGAVTGERLVSLDMSDLSKGIYLLRVLLDEEHHVRVIIKN